MLFLSTNWAPMFFFFLPYFLGPTLCIFFPSVLLRKCCVFSQQRNFPRILKTLPGSNVNLHGSCPGRNGIQEGTTGIQESTIGNQEGAIGIQESRIVIRRSEKGHTIFCKCWEAFTFWNKTIPNRFLESPIAFFLLVCPDDPPTPNKKGCWRGPSIVPLLF